jgi:hypothetical protein
MTHDQTVKLSHIIANLVIQHCNGDSSAVYKAEGILETIGTLFDDAQLDVIDETVRAILNVHAQRERNAHLN